MVRPIVKKPVKVVTKKPVAKKTTSKKPVNTARPARTFKRPGCKKCGEKKKSIWK